MEEIKDLKFEQWLKDQIRLAGKELIRRSESFTQDGLDGLSYLSINIDIPTYHEEIEFPRIEFSFDLVNKKHCEWLMEGNDPYTEKTNGNGEN